MNQAEQTAHDAILQWCRSDKKASRFYQPVMRNSVKGGVCVIDVARSEPNPNAKYSWETRPMEYARGNSWIECYEQLKNEIDKVKT